MKSSDIRSSMLPNLKIMIQSRWHINPLNQIVLTHVKHQVTKLLNNSDIIWPGYDHKNSFLQNILLLLRYQN